MVEERDGRLRILKNAGTKLERYNEQYREVRESYLDVLNARGNDMSLVGELRNVSVESLGKVEKALRSYLGMARFGRMERNNEGSFTERLKRKIEGHDTQAVLRKLRDVHILSPRLLDEYERDARRIYECLSTPGKDGLAADGTRFCVGTTKIMHCLFPELFIMLDSVMAKALYYNGYRHSKRKFNNFTTYWKEAMRACHDELEAWREIYGNTDSLLELDNERPTTLVRIFDKCRLYSLGAK